MKKILSDLSDFKLLDIGATGNEAALSILFDKYFYRLHGYAFSLIKDREVAKEIAMDVMTRLWEKRGTIIIKEEESLSPYLFTSIKNAVYNHLRRNKILTVPIDEPSFTDQFSHDSSADSPLVLRELESTINGIIEGLPEQRRKIFYLCREENLTYAEVAQRLNLSVNTVRNQMSASINYLRKHLNSEVGIKLLIIYQISQFLTDNIS